VAKRATGKFELVGFHYGFHGRTYTAMSVGGLAGTKRGYGPIMPGAIHVPYPYPYRPPLGVAEADLADATFELMEAQIRASSTGSVAAVMIEPYLGGAGFIFPPDGFLKRLEQWCREREILMILDEVQSGFGRTGKMFMAEWEGLRPQLMAVGKGIGSGIPTACLMAEKDVIAAVGQGEMSSTCGGNPVSSAACIAVLDIMKKEGLAENARRMGEILMGRLKEIQERCPYLGDVRGRGLVMGMELVKDKKTKEPAPDLVRKLLHLCAERGLLIGNVGIFGNVVRVAPPLVIDEDQVHRSCDIMADALAAL
jgi:4-aminobutyrate aminotransferase/(S)-3-amino-2-methylpropionate transaminase